MFTEEDFKLIEREFEGLRISSRDRCGDEEEKEFVRTASRAAGGRVAVISLYRAGEREFLRRCAEKLKLKINVDAPDLLEEVPSGDVLEYRRRAFFLAYPDRGGSGEDEESTHVQNKGK